MKCRFTLILLWPQNNQRFSFQNISKKWKKNEEKWLDKDITGTKPNLLFMVVPQKRLSNLCIHGWKKNLGSQISTLRWSFQMIHVSLANVNMNVSLAPY